MDVPVIGTQKGYGGWFLGHDWLLNAVGEAVAGTLAALFKAVGGPKWRANFDLGQLLCKQVPNPVAHPTEKWF
ncbi:hypothetical protein GCM10027217_09470 [Pseudomaricurvus hydrocarbonicus]